MLVIKFNQGLYSARTHDSGSATHAPSLEKLLERLDPGAPPEKIAAAAEILEGIIGKDQGQIRHGVITS